MLNLAAFEWDEAGGGGAESRNHNDRKLDSVVPTVEEGGFSYLARSAVGVDAENPAAGWDVFVITKDDVLEAGACGDIDA